MLTTLKNKHSDFCSSNKEKISDWWKQINKWREKNLYHIKMMINSLCLNMQLKDCMN